MRFMGVLVGSALAVAALLLARLPDLAGFGAGAGGAGRGAVVWAGCLVLGLFVAAGQ